VDRAVTEWLGEGLVDEAMLLEQRQSCEAWSRHGYLEVVASAGAILDAQLGRLGERALQQAVQRIGGHAADRSGAYSSFVDELGLFPLDVVLLPTERLPLHIFEPRYKELIGECLAEQREFGLLLGDQEGLRHVGTRAAVVEVLDRLPDGRLNIVVEGRQRFRLVELTEGRSFATGEVEPLADEAQLPAQAQRDRALHLYRELAKLVKVEVDEPDPDSGVLSFELAARVDFGVERKQELLEATSEPDRLARVGDLLRKAIEAIRLERQLAESAARNGRGVSRRA
jgi:Lon protease-like protein